jgi:hypothetical protein
MHVLCGRRHHIAAGCTLYVLAAESKRADVVVTRMVVPRMRINCVASNRSFSFAACRSWRRRAALVRRPAESLSSSAIACVLEQCRDVFYVCGCACRALHSGRLDAAGIPRRCVARRHLARAAVAVHLCRGAEEVCLRRGSSTEVGPATVAPVPSQRQRDVSRWRWRRRFCGRNVEGTGQLFCKGCCVCGYIMHMCCRATVRAGFPHAFVRPVWRGVGGLADSSQGQGGTLLRRVVCPPRCSCSRRPRCQVAGAARVGICARLEAAHDGEAASADEAACRLRARSSPGKLSKVHRAAPLPDVVRCRDRP